MYPSYSPHKSPYLSIGDIVGIASVAAGIAAAVMFILTSVILILTVVFIILKVLALITFGWGWVFSPIWIPALGVVSVGLTVFVGAQLINFGIFIRRLVKRK